MDEPALYNGCEVTSLAMLLQYNGIDVTKNQLAEEIPTVPLIDEEGNYGDPNKALCWWCLWSRRRVQCLPQADC